MNLAVQSHINTFEKGMNKDLAKTVLPKSQYLDARNVRILTESGQSSLALINILGNSYKKTIPSTYNTWLVCILGSLIPDGPWSLTITLQSISSIIPYTISGSSVTSIIQTYLKAFSEDSPSGFYTLGFRAAESTSTSITIWGATQELYSIGNSPVLPPGCNLTITASLTIPAQTNLVPIGFCTIRDDIILATTSWSNRGNKTGPGQWWRLQYNKSTLALKDPELLYNNTLDFSIDHPIQAEGRYETPAIQRIYWTDFNKDLRTLNIADENCFGTPSTLLDFGTYTQPAKVVVQKIVGGGVLKTGLYYYTFRLRKGGAVTGYAPLSNRVRVVSKTEAILYDHYWWVGNEYYGDLPGTVTTKSISLKITGLDSMYDVIEIAFLYRSTIAAVPECFLLEEQPVPSDGILEFVHSGTEAISQLTLQDIINRIGKFTKVKSLCVKDNRLFVANVMLEGYNDISYNAQAYRYNSAGNTYVGNVNVNEDPEDPLCPQIIKDAINPYNTKFLETTPVNWQTDTDGYIYQSDGITMGGEGPNIKYKFVKKHLTACRGLNYQDNPPLVSIAKESVYGITTDGKSLYGNLDAFYPNSDMWFDYKSPYVDGVLRSYARGEIYRFALILWDKLGRPCYAKWMGDIRFPEAWFLNDTSYGIEGFPIATDWYGKYTDGYPWPVSHSNRQILVALGLEFTFNIASIRNSISGLTVARVERTPANRTRLGMGVLMPTHHPGDLTSQGQSGEGYITNYKLSDKENLYGVSTFDCPDFLFNDPPDKGSGDFIRIASRLHGTDVGGGTSEVEISSAGNDGVRYVVHGDARFKDSGDITIQKDHLITESFPCDPGGRIPGVFAGVPFYNYALYFSPDPDRVTSAGNKTFVLNLYPSPPIAGQWSYGGSYPYTPLSQENNLLASYVRPLMEQYGGNTQTARSFNVYISCGSFVPVNDNSPDIITVEVFGGDTFVSYFDLTKQEQNKAGVVPTQYLADTHSDFFDTSGIVFPCESFINTSLRKGYHLLNKRDIGGGYPHTLQGFDFDEFQLYSVYSAEDNFWNFITKPFDVTEVITYDNRIYASDIKINGEIYDAWRTFSPDNYMDVNGSYGPINDILVFKDTLVSFQDKAFAQVISDPNVAVQGSDGISIELGSSQKVLYDHKYISVQHGSRHQWGIVSTSSGIYFWDANSRKIMCYSQVEVPLSDIKGLSAFMYNNINGEILSNDNPFLNKGITATYDKRYKDIIFTFRDRVIAESMTCYYSTATVVYVPGLTASLTVTPGSEWELLSSSSGEVLNILTVLTVYYDVVLGRTFIEFTFSHGLVTGNSAVLANYTCTDNTVVFNEHMNSFMTFIDCAPPIYINDGSIILTPSPDNTGKLYMQDTGDYGMFYDIVYPSTVKVMVNPFPFDIKVYDNIFFHLELYDLNNVNIPDETLSRVRYYTDYQNTDYHNLVPGTNVRRVEREWKMGIPRDVVVNAGVDIFDPSNMDPAAKFKQRIRDKYMTVDVEYDNQDNRRMVLHYLRTLYRSSKR